MDAVAGDKMAAFVEMKVRRRCSFVDVVCWGKDGGVCGDEGEEMLFVVARVVRRCWRLWQRW